MRWRLTGSHRTLLAAAGGFIQRGLHAPSSSLVYFKASSGLTTNLRAVRDWLGSIDFARRHRVLVLSLHFPRVRTLSLHGCGWNSEEALTLRCLAAYLRCSYDLLDPPQCLHAERRETAADDHRVGRVI
ncbi:hypothetical protein R3P38DRAFT_3232359 [Favolaschia claudopus]|uniref:Uncharacterized protein n=1 Tax=Favolaschia claudopus TaxID=2862362 RepID=A0AAV9ZI81_9AGAR